MAEDMEPVRENLREFIDKLVDQGYTVRDGQSPDPDLIDPGGSAVETWREDYPYDERMTREDYELLARRAARHGGIESAGLERGRYARAGIGCDAAIRHRRR